MKASWWCGWAALLLAAGSARGADPAEIDAFWRETRAQLDAVPMEAEVERTKDPLPFHVYRVTLRSLGNVKISGWLALPVKGEGPAEPWPVIVTAPGYSGRAHAIMLGECQRGYAVLQIYPRSQGESEQWFKIDGPEKLTWGLDRPEGAYYQGGYADVMRAIDFVASRPDLDASRIALVGTSQGGGIALAVAALDPRVKAVAAHVPFLCNVRMAAGIKGSGVNRRLEQAGRNDEAALRTLDFFDPWQLAPRLKIPVLMSAGGKDTVCPAETIRSVFERLAGPKALHFYPELPHTSCNDFYNLQWPWLARHLRPPVSAHDNAH